jgi:hypothetical protein
MTRALLALIAALAWAPAFAGLGSFDLGAGQGTAVVAPGASPRREQDGRFRMRDLTSGRVIARSGAMTICTDGKIRDAARARKLRRGDRDHQQTTSLTTGRQEALDPDRIPFFVLPRRFGAARLGDLALVTYNGRSAWAVAGDNGPCEGCMVGRKKHKHPYVFGEGSVALARALGIPGAESGNGGGVSSGVSYLIFPGTAPKDGFRTEAELRRHIDETGAALYGRYFGDPRPVRVASLDRR